MPVLILLLFGVGAEPIAIEDTCDVCELNHVYDENGALIFTQLIWSDWTGDRFDIVDWRIVKPEFSITHAEVIWFDGNMRRVRVAQFVETWTMFDRELTERERLPTCQRRGLTRRKGG